jgi:hypothetical protein
MTRQVYNDTWASGGDIVDPGAIKYTIGWIVEAPPLEHANYWQGRTDEMLQHLERNGIATFDATSVYELGGYAREGTVTYRSLVVTNTGNLPSTSPVQWVQAFLIPGNNLSDLADAPTARTNLGVDVAGTINYVHPNHSGDVTSVADGATTISSNVVTNTKLADIATNTIKGRIGAGTGDPQDLTPANVRTIINVEDGATADQTGAEIKVAYEGVANTNAFTDAEQTKLTGIETGATADQTKADIDALEIDAGSLDDLDSTQFLRSDVSDTMTGALTFNTVVSSVQAKSVNSTTTDEMAMSLWTASGKFWGIRPYPAGVGDTAKDFGYNFTTAKWTFDETPYVGANAVLNAGDLGVTVQGYDVDTTKDDVASARTADLTFNDNVYLKLGTSGAESTFRSNGTHSYMNLVAAASDFYIQSATVNKFLFDGSLGDFHADGDVIAASTSVGSDRKIKKDIRPIEDASSKLDSLVGVQYTLIKNDKADAGLIAQDVQSVLPEAVKEVAFLDGEEGETYLSLNYNAVIGLLVAGFQEEKAKRINLEERLSKLEE